MLYVIASCLPLRLCVTSTSLSAGLSEQREQYSGIVEEWAEIHQTELLQMWNSRDFHKLEPLV